MKKPGQFIEYVLTWSDAKFTHPMARRVFGQLILSNIDAITRTILAKEAVFMQMDPNSDNFKNSDRYKEIMSIAESVKNGSGEKFSKFVELIPSETIDQFKALTEGWVRKVFFKNNNKFGEKLQE